MRKLSVLPLVAFLLASCGGTAPTAQPPAASASKPAASAPTVGSAAASPATASSPRLAAASANQPSAGGDPVAVFRRAIDARNRGDVAGFLESFADDAVRVDRPCGAQGCVGKEAIRRTTEEDVKGHINVTVLSAGNAGGTVIARTEIRNDAAKAQGLDRMISIYAVEVRGGQIVGWRSVPDLSDPQTAGAQPSGAASGSPKP